MSDVTVDRALTDDLRTRLGARHPVATAATVTADGIRLAAIGCALDSDFELGSISKGITGLLYVDALDRGELRHETTLGELLPLHGSDAAGVTLGALSTHTSGLPSIPPAAHPYRRTVRFWRHGTNPYGQTLDELLEQTKSVKLSAPRPRYSNLGFQLLGHTMARAAGMTFVELLQQRVAGPLGLKTMYAPADPAELRPAAIVGRSRRGRAQEAWTGEALAPAGGIRASIVDAAQLAQALLDGSAPGIDALDPIRDFTGRAVRIGAAWITLEVNGRLITFHNGGTGGFRTWVGLDRAAGTAVVLLSATAVAVDRQGFRMLEELGK